MSSSVSCLHVGDPDVVAVVRLDDGRANALDPEVMDDLESALVTLAPDAAAVVLTGRPGFFCAGLDRALTVPGREADLEAAMARFARLLVTLLSEPRPLVAAVTGHALAAGTLLAMCADRVVAAAGDHSWGLVETRIGVAQAPFGLELARYRLGPAADSWALLGETKTPAEAHASGVVHTLTGADDVVQEAIRAAHDLATIPTAAFAATKTRLRSALCTTLLQPTAHAVADPRGGA